MPKITILYDTSYLMAAGRPFFEIEEYDHVTCAYAREKFKHNNNYEEYIECLNDEIEIAKEFGRLVQFEHVIPTEIKAEIAIHFNDPEKVGKARRARTACSKIFALPNFEEISLANLTPIEPMEKLLGPDSIVDKKLVHPGSWCGGQVPVSMSFDSWSA